MSDRTASPLDVTVAIAGIDAPARDVFGPDGVRAALRHAERQKWSVPFLRQMLRFDSWVAQVEPGERRFDFE